MKKRRRASRPGGVAPKRQKYTKMADFAPVLTSGFCIHLKSKFTGIFQRKKGEHSTNPYNSRALDFRVLWNQDLGRDSGGGHPGTTDMDSKLIVAFIARKCTPQSCHWSFTDVGCAQVSATSMRAMRAMNNQ